MTKEAFFDEIADIIISTITVKLTAKNTWATSGDVFDDENLARLRRQGMYAWVEAWDTNEYASAFDWPMKQFKFGHQRDVIKLTGVVEYKLNQTLSGNRPSKYRNEEQLSDAIKKLEQETVGV